MANEYLENATVPFRIENFSYENKVVMETMFRHLENTNFRGVSVSCCFCLLQHACLDFRPSLSKKEHLPLLFKHFKGLFYGYRQTSFFTLQKLKGCYYICVVISVVGNLLVITQLHRSSTINSLCRHVFDMTASQSCMLLIIVYNDSKYEADVTTQE